MDELETLANGFASHKKEKTNRTNLLTANVSDNGKNSQIEEIVKTKDGPKLKITRSVSSKEIRACSFDYVKL